ncbi:formin-like protein 16 [Papio anubis]|uniref:formin-like protein 16 n=1 Tax=Papio anubis TaxID=9555 RepID=UPI0012AD5F88|nr:formin-like protein 16 [Papio anubis]
MDHAARRGWVHSDTRSRVHTDRPRPDPRLEATLRGPPLPARARPQPGFPPQSRSERGPPAPPRGWPRKMPVPNASPQSPSAATPRALFLLPGPGHTKGFGTLRTLRVLHASTDASLPPPEAGAASVARHPSVALTTAGAVRVKKLQVLRRAERNPWSREHEELVSVSDLYLRPLRLPSKDAK